MANDTAEMLVADEKTSRVAPNRLIPRKAEPCDLSRDSIERFSEIFVKQIGYDPRMSLEEIVSRFGGTLQTTDNFDDLTKGSITVYDEADFIIKIPSFASAARDRFTIAHELGHLVLHYLWPKYKDPAFGPIFASRYGSDDEADDLAEREANWFAAAFLMPADKTKNAWKQEGSVMRIASEFNVAPETARLRLQSLGIEA